MEHRISAIRLALMFAVFFAVGAIWTPPLLVTVIVYLVFALFLLSPLADWIENRER